MFNVKELVLSQRQHNGNQVAQHLMMIQGVIDRFGRNSFFLKGASISVLAAGLFFIVRSEINSWFLILIFAIPIVGLWIFDGYFIYYERLFREIYNEVRKRGRTNFSMEYQEYIVKPKSGYPKCIFSKTLCWFYLGELVFAVGIIAIYILWVQ